MTNQLNQPQILLYSTLAAVATGAILMPPGAALPHLMYWAALFSAGGALGAYAYARGEAAPEDVRDESLSPAIEWHSTVGQMVPASLLAGSEPLIGLVAEGQVANPRLAERLTPYFAEPTVAFVQGAMRYDGTGGVADAFRMIRALGSESSSARNALNAVELTGSGALVSREALRAAWQPGDTWQMLGMRLQAMGYSGRFEAEPMALSWAPSSMSEYASALVSRTRQTLSTALSALLMRGLPLAARLQYVSTAAAYLAVWFAALMGALSAFTLVAYDAGPVILTSPAARVGDALAAASVGVVLFALYRLTKVNPARPLALSLAGAYTVAGELAYRSATSTYAKRAAQAVWGTARGAYLTVRGGGSADTAPAGTPARS